VREKGEKFQLCALNPRIRVYKRLIGAERGR
jgi:hypothetical protein